MAKKKTAPKKINISRFKQIKPKENKIKKITIQILAILIVLAVIVIIANLINKPKEVCIDTCNNDQCSEKDFLACTLQENGCLALINKGKVLSQCGVKCLSDSQCKFNEICQNNICILSSYSKQQDETKCGNNMPDFGETCSSCPSDIICSQGYSCINAQCKQKGLFEGQEEDGVRKIGKCGYLHGDASQTNRYATENIAWKAITFYNSCVTPFSIESDASKLYDRSLVSEKNIWECYEPKGISFPQFASIKLNKEYVINRAKIFQNSIGSEAMNVRDYALYASVDSTNGADGHWIKVSEGILPEGFRKAQNVFFDPVSARWVKLEVKSMYNLPYKAFGIAELYVYEAPFICSRDWSPSIDWNPP